jgi:hypothetical protein
VLLPEGTPLPQIGQNYGIDLSRARIYRAA